MSYAPIKLQETINYKYYEKKIPKDVFDYAILYDPTGNQKYARWIVDSLIVQFKDFRTRYSQVQDEQIWKVLKPLASNELKNWLSFYHQCRERNILPERYKNITYFETIDDFLNWIASSEDNLLSLLNSKEAKSNTRVLYKDKEHFLITPLTHKSCRKYGTGTDWCTATANESFFISYSKHGDLFILRYLNPDGSLDLSRGYHVFIPSEDFEDEFPLQLRDIGDKSVLSNPPVIDDFENFFKGINDQKLVQDMKSKIQRAIDAVINNKLNIQNIEEALLHLPFKLWVAL